VQTVWHPDEAKGGSQHDLIDTDSLVSPQTSPNIPNKKASKAPGPCRHIVQRNNHINMHIDVVYKTCDHGLAVISDTPSVIHERLEPRRRLAQRHRPALQLGMLQAPRNGTVASAAYRTPFHLSDRTRSCRDAQTTASASQCSATSAAQPRDAQHGAHAPAQAPADMLEGTEGAALSNGALLPTRPAAHRCVRAMYSRWPCQHLEAALRRAAVVTAATGKETVDLAQLLADAGREAETWQPLVAEGRL
jgi:hypothetical protein